MSVDYSRSFGDTTYYSFKYISPHISIQVYYSFNYISQYVSNDNTLYRPSDRSFYFTNISPIDVLNTITG